MIETLRRIYKTDTKKKSARISKALLLLAAFKNRRITPAL
jgi:hypothetical protein